MTINELASELNVSTQAIYQRLKRAGFTVDSLKDPNKPTNSGILSDAGISIIRSLYSKVTNVSTPTNIQQPAAPADADAINQLVNQLNTLTAERDHLTAERDRLAADNAALTAAASADRQTIAALTAQLATLSEQAMQQAAAAQRLADQAQQLHALHLKALPQPSAHPVRQWLHSLFRHDANTNTGSDD